MSTAVPPPAPRRHWWNNAWYNTRSYYYDSSTGSWRWLRFIVTFLLFLLFILLLLAIKGCADASGSRPLAGMTYTPTPPATATVVPTATPTTTVTASPTTTVTAIPSGTSAPAVAPSPTVTVSPTATATATPQCATLDESSYGLSVTQFRSATDTDWLTRLRQAGQANSRFTRVVYTGEYVNLPTLNKWMDAAVCNGYFPEVNLDNVFAAFKDDQSGLESYLKEAVKHEHLQHWVISANRAGADLDKRVAFLKQVTPQMTIEVWGDWPITISGQNVMPIYLPWPEPNNYGSVSNYSKVGHDAVAQQGAMTAWVGVQAFDWRQSAALSKPTDPSEQQFVDQMQFQAGRPGPSDVGHFAQLLREQGVRKVLLYAEEPSSDDITYLTDCARMVVSALGG